MKPVFRGTQLSLKLSPKISCVALYTIPEILSVRERHTIFSEADDNNNGKNNDNCSSNGNNGNNI